jgi:DNA-binding transcriptional MerR regulator
MSFSSDPATHRLTLDQLCRMAGVTVRTVRYYIAEGLLPPPQGQGLAARYGELHLQRLRAIAALKERYLPLREIRRVLDGLDEEGIAHLAAGNPGRLEEPAPASSQRLAPEAGPESDASGSSAATYIEELLGRTLATPAPVQRAAEPAPPDRAWRRLSITAEAELLIDAELYARRQKQIDSLLAWARRLLGGS